MLPDVQRFPPHGTEFAILPCVPFAIRGNLVCPPCRVGLGSNSVLRTAVPETTVDKDGQPQPDDDDVGTTGKIATVQPESDPAPVKFPSQYDLRTSVSAREALHEPAHRFAGRGWCTAGLLGHKPDFTRGETGGHQALSTRTIGSAPRGTIIPSATCGGGDATEDSSS